MALADLPQQHWIDLSGKLVGRADVSSGQGRFPSAEMRLSGVNIGNASLTANSLELSVKLDWPIMQVSSANFRFDDGSAANVSANLDLNQKSLTASHFQFDGR